ncbi:membrane protein [Sesbania bispinosa]|nr:membrane protein [Sesbania bispinosa]
MEGSRPRRRLHEADGDAGTERADGASWAHVRGVRARTTMDEAFDGGGGEKMRREKRELAPEEEAAAMAAGCATVAGALSGGWSAQRGEEDWAAAVLRGRV